MAHEVWQTGRCLCGAVRYRLSAPPKWTTFCHCDSCRRATSAPVVAWMGFAPEEVTWEGQLQGYQSSEHAQRGFCGTCGSPMCFESTRWPGEIHLYAISLDQPEAYVPQLHCYTEEQLSWLHMNDPLPRFPGTADAQDASQ